MSRLSWRDTASPNFGSSVSDVVRANKLLQDSIGGISTGLGNFSAANKASQAEALTKQQEAAQGQLLAGVLQRAGEGRSTQDWIQQAGSEYAANPSMYNPADIEGILKHLNTAATDNTNLVNLAETERKNAQNAGWDDAAKQYQGIQAEALLRQQAGDVAGAEQLQRDSYSLLADLKLGDQRDVIGGSDTTRGNREGYDTNLNSRRIANEGNTRGWISTNEASQRHSNDQTDRNEKRLAEELAARAIHGGFNQDSQTGLLFGTARDNDVTSRITQKALEIAAASTQPMGWQAGGGNAQAGGQGGATGGINPSTGQAYTSGEEIYGQTTSDDVGVRQWQNELQAKQANWDALGKDDKPIAEVVKEMTGPDGALNKMEAGKLIQLYHHYKEQNGGVLSTGQFKDAMYRSVDAEPKFLKREMFNPYHIDAEGGMGWFPDSTRVDGKKVNQILADTTGDSAMGAREQNVKLESYVKDIKTAKSKYETAQKNKADAERQRDVMGVPVPEYVENAFIAATEEYGLVSQRARELGGSLQKDALDGSAPLTTASANKKKVEERKASNQKAAIERRKTMLDNAETKIQKIRHDLSSAKKRLADTPRGKFSLRSAIRQDIRRMERELPEAITAKESLQ